MKNAFKYLAKLAFLVFIYFAVVIFSIWVTSLGGECIAEYIDLWSGDYVADKVMYGGVSVLVMLLILLVLRFKLPRKVLFRHGVWQVRAGWLLAAAVMATPWGMTWIFSPSFTLTFPDAVAVWKMLAASVFVIFAGAFREEVIDRALMLKLGTHMKVGALVLVLLQAVLFWRLHGPEGRTSLETTLWYLTFGCLAGVIYYFSGIVAATMTHTVVNLALVPFSGGANWFAGPLFSGAGAYYRVPMLNCYMLLTVVALVLLIYVEIRAGRLGWPFPHRLGERGNLVPVGQP